MKILLWILGAFGVVAFILMVAAFYFFLTAQHKARKTKDAEDWIKSVDQYKKE